MAAKPTGTKKLIRATQRLMADALKDLTDALDEAEVDVVTTRSLLKRARIAIGGMGRNLEGAIEELDVYIDAAAKEV